MLLVSKLEPENIQALIAPDAVPADLETGDFLDTESGLLIERKSAPDLLASIGDGRLYSQCSRMTNISTIPLLLVHGSILPDKDYKVVADGRKTNWNYWSVMNSLISVQQGGVMVAMIPTNVLPDFVEYIRRWAKENRHRTVQKPKGIWIEPTKPEQIMALIAGGQIRARAILNKYVTVLNSLKHVDEWDRLPGVGKKTITKAIEIIGGKP